MPSPLPLNPLEIYCHALSRRPPCCRVKVSLDEKETVVLAALLQAGGQSSPAQVARGFEGREYPSLLVHSLCSPHHRHLPTENVGDERLIRTLQRVLAQAGPPAKAPRRGFFS